MHARVTQPAPSREVASTSGRLVAKTSSPSSGGTWLKTVCVCQGALLSREGCEAVAMSEVKQIPA